MNWFGIGSALGYAAGGAEDRRRSDVDLGDFTLSRAADAALEEARRRRRRRRP